MNDIGSLLDILCNDPRSRERDQAYSEIESCFREYQARAERAEENLERVRKALERAEIQFSDVGSWCQLCRTYTLGRRAHVHHTSCVLGDW